MVASVERKGTVASKTEQMSAKFVTAIIVRPCLARKMALFYMVACQTGPKKKQTRMISYHTNSRGRISFTFLYKHKTIGPKQVLSNV